MSRRRTHKIIHRESVATGNGAMSLGAQMYGNLIQEAAHGRGKEADQTRLLMAGITAWGGNLQHWDGQIPLGPTREEMHKNVAQAVLTANQKIDDEAGKWFFGLGRMFTGPYHERADKIIPEVIGELVPNVGKTMNVSGRIKNGIIEKFGFMVKTLAHQKMEEIIKQQENVAIAAAKADAAKPTVAPATPAADAGWLESLRADVKNVAENAKKEAIKLAPTAIQIGGNVAEVVINNKIHALTEHMKKLPFDQLMRMDVSRETMMKYLDFTNSDARFPGMVNEKTYGQEVGHLTAKVHAIGTPIIRHMAEKKQKELRAVAEPLIAACVKDDQCVLPSKKELERMKRNAARGILGQHSGANKPDAELKKSEISQAPKFGGGHGMGMSR